MHLKSLMLKGFKSFPDRTRLEFAPGVSVVVGPNGSGKSNITDAVLWAMGEQSPLAVRGASMQDVIFGGGRGVQARTEAEVELVIDNSDGAVALPFSEISVVRRLTRTGEGEYRLNGARCRLGDVLEALSDTGLGKESHSIISQGRVEGIVLSKPRDRRLLIEEAAGLGKHRKRRRRAQLKLDRTLENLDRALDVEREARSRLRPLKRQAEAAELHRRLEQQLLEARLVLAREELRARRAELGEAEDTVREARDTRAEVETGLEEVMERRAAAERALAERSERHEALARRTMRAGAAHERLELRREHAAATAEALTERRAHLQGELASLREVVFGARGEPAADEAEGVGGELAEVGRRVAALEREVAELESEGEEHLARELAEMEGDRERAATEAAELQAALGEAREAVAEADEQAAETRAELREAESAVEAARREAARVGSELAAVNQFLRNHAHAPAAGAGTAQRAPDTLSGVLSVKPGYELALAAALGRRLDAALVSDLAGAAALLDRAGPDGASALLADARGDRVPRASASQPPAPGAQAAVELLDGPPEALATAARLLADTWVVERLEDLPEAFAGTAVTRGGRVWFAVHGEVRQVNEGGAERVLARRNEREQLIAAVERVAQAEHAARAAADRAREECLEAASAREATDEAHREATREHARAVERERHAGWLIEQRRAAPLQGPLAVRRAQLEGELAAERRQAERLEREHAERVARLQRLGAQLAADEALAPRAQRLAEVLGGLGETLAGHLAALQGELDRDRATGEEMAGELRACAGQEAEIQTRLRAQGEAVTAAEVAAQRLRDQAADAEMELREVRARLEPEEQGEGERADGEPGADSSVQAESSADGQEGLRERALSVVGESEPLAEEESELPAEQESPEQESPEQESQLLAEEESEPLAEEEVQALQTRVERLRRRREQLGPVNPLAREEYAQALAHVEELESWRVDLETALRELRTVIRDTDRQIHETFQATFEAAARNFEELAADLFPGGRGRLRLVQDAPGPRPVLGGQPLAAEGEAQDVASNGAGAPSADAAAEGEPESDGGESAESGPGDLMGVEIEITPAGKSTKRLSLLSGGEKSMTALAFLFAVFLARPCPFYILDEVEAALDDLNLERFIALLRRYAGRAQFIVITHQRRTMEAADALYGVSMAGNGVSRVISRRLPAEAAAQNGVVPGESVPGEPALREPEAAEPAPEEPEAAEPAPEEPEAEEPAPALPAAMAEVA